MAKQISGIESLEQLAELCRETIATREPIALVQPGTESVSIIPTAELESLMETVYLFRSRENATRLLDALNRAEANVNSPRTVNSLRQEFGLVEEKASA